MLFTEWNWDDAIEVAREDGVAIGEAKGMEKVFSLLEQGIPLAEARKKLGLR